MLGFLVHGHWKDPRSTLASTWQRKYADLSTSIGRVHDLMRDKIGEDLVRPAVTRFATSFLTLTSMYKHRDGLKIFIVMNGMLLASLPLKKVGKLRTLSFQCHFGMKWIIA